MDSPEFKSPNLQQCYGDGFRCCFPFYFLAPTANPNPIWPRNGYDPVTKEIMADMKFGAYNALLPKKLAFGIQIAHRTSEGDYTRYVDPSIDLSKCTLRWRNLLVSSTTSEALTTPVSFSPKQRACDSSEFTATKNQVYSCAFCMDHHRLLAVTDLFVSFSLQ